MAPNLIQVSPTQLAAAKELPVGADTALNTLGISTPIGNLKGHPFNKTFPVKAP